MSETLKRVRAAAKQRAAANEENQKAQQAGREYAEAWEAAALALVEAEAGSVVQGKPLATLAGLLPATHRDSVLATLAETADSAADAGQWLVLEAIRLFGEGKDKSAKAAITERLRLDCSHSLKKSLWDVYQRFHSLRKAETAPPRKPKASLPAPASYDPKTPTQQVAWKIVQAEKGDGKIDPERRTSIIREHNRQQKIQASKVKRESVLCAVSDIKRKLGLSNPHG